MLKKIRIDWNLTGRFGSVVHLPSDDLRQVLGGDRRRRYEQEQPHRNHQHHSSAFPQCQRHAREFGGYVGIWGKWGNCGDKLTVGNY